MAEQSKELHSDVNFYSFIPINRICSLESFSGLVSLGIFF